MVYKLLFINHLARGISPYIIPVRRGFKCALSSLFKQFNPRLKIEIGHKKTLSDHLGPHTRLAVVQLENHALVFERLAHLSREITIRLRKLCQRMGRNALCLNRIWISYASYYSGWCTEMCALIRSYPLNGSCHFGMENRAHSPCLWYMSVYVYILSYLFYVNQRRPTSTKVPGLTSVCSRKEARDPLHIGSHYTIRGTF